MKSYIYTEASQTIGFGHLTRCIAIYEALTKRGVISHLLISGDLSVASLLKEIPHTVINWLNEKDLDTCMKKKSDITIIDSYLADKKIYERIARAANLTVYIDDNNRLNYPKGIVVNGNIYANQLSYSKKHDQSYLLGSTYTILRDEFLNVPKKNIRKEIQHILITFGGDDIRNMTPKILRALDVQYPNTKKTAIIGAGFHHAKQLLRYQGNNTLCVFNPSVSQIKELMMDADIAISGGGQTLYEFACTGTPAVAVVIADNQIENARELEKRKLIVNAGFWREKNIVENMIKKISLLMPAAKRKTMSLLGQELIDGHGADRVASHIVSSYISRNIIVRPVRLEDEKQILDLSNNPTIRILSFQTKHITKKEHSKWFQKKLSDKNCLYLVAVVRDTLVGQLRLDILNTEATISISVHPGYQGHGIGSKLFRRGVDMLHSKHPFVQNITALIKKENLASQLFFKTIGFNQKEKTRKSKPNTLRYNYELSNRSYAVNCHPEVCPEGSSLIYNRFFAQTRKYNIAQNDKKNTMRKFCK